MANVYTVSDVVTMFGVNHEETVRRWIRDERLPAKRGLGRGGSTMLLEDIVAFANKPPRAYLKSLVSWLDAEGIEYRLIYDPLIAEHTQILDDAALITKAIPLAGAIVGTSISAIKKSHVPFTVELVSTPESSSTECIADNENLHTCSTTNSSVNSPACESNSDNPSNKAPSLPTPPNEKATINEKIREEQIKLIKLKQELAQIQAQISITEGQIEYYNLLLENN